MFILIVLFSNSKMKSFFKELIDRNIIQLLVVFFRLNIYRSASLKLTMKVSEVKIFSPTIKILSTI